MISSEGWVASHLAMTTFCWLPPLIVLASMSRAAVLTSSLPAHGPAKRVLGTGGEQPGPGQAAA